MSPVQCVSKPPCLLLFLRSLFIPRNQYAFCVVPWTLLLDFLLQREGELIHSAIREVLVVYARVPRNDAPKPFHLEVIDKGGPSIENICSSF